MNGLMYGAGRLKKNGHDLVWGIGRHGPGNNVYSYFVEPNGFVTEYTTEVEQVDDSYQFHDAAYWKSLNIFPDRWGLAAPPSELAHKGMAGELVEEENLRCEQAMARKLGR
jgi:catechol 2,3-dioxygenase